MFWKNKIWTEWFNFKWNSAIIQEWGCGGQGCYFQPNPRVISQISASHKCTDPVFMTWKCTFDGLIVFKTSRFEHRYSELSNKRGGANKRAVRAFMYIGEKTRRCEKFLKRIRMCYTLIRELRVFKFSRFFERILVARTRRPTIFHNIYETFKDLEIFI